MRLHHDLEGGRLWWPDAGLSFAELPYRCSIGGATESGERFRETALRGIETAETREGTVIRGMFESSGIELVRTYRRDGEDLVETISLANRGAAAVSLERLDIGFVADITRRPGWRFCAIPFRVQLNGRLHDYDVDALRTGAFGNTIYTDRLRADPPLVEEGWLRSEAWAWYVGDRGLAVMKYNAAAIELSAARVDDQGDSARLRFGGIGFALYGEPSEARVLAPGAHFTFGSTTYAAFEGGLANAFLRYRRLLEEKGHGFPEDYDPPVNWNELYDVGLFAVDRERLGRSYTRAAILGEAAKARECSCELLYLDPGWSRIEGASLWDEERLGPVADLVATLRDEYGLGLGYRTALRCYADHWPRGFLVKHALAEPGPVDYASSEYGWPGPRIWEPCLCNLEFWREKLRRLVAISSQGVRFMMFDEMDWRGPCYDASHGHPVPTTPLDHVRAVYALCKAVREACPQVIIEAHDPVWPWLSSVYAPTYLGQGFGPDACYQENWGFEFMWDCLADLKSGKAMALYWYALGCGIPLYLHITMAADNDRCLFFWWVASTVRHIGVGGRRSDKSIEPPWGLPPFDPERRYQAYRRTLAAYRRLKPWFARGKFIGFSETVHLHTLPGRLGGVVNVFNLADDPQEITCTIPREAIGAAGGRGELPVVGAAAAWTAGAVELRLRLQAMSPAVVRIGDAAREERDE